MLAAPVVLVSENGVLAPPAMRRRHRVRACDRPGRGGDSARDPSRPSSPTWRRGRRGAAAGGDERDRAPDTGLLNASVTTTIKGAANAAPTAADWPLPLTTAIALAAPFKFVSVKAAGVPTLAVEALTVYVPATVPAVTAIETWPDESVVPERAASMAVAPLPGTLKVTGAPGTATPRLSRTIETIGAAKAAAAAADWPLPLTTVMELGAPMLRKLKLVDAEVPLTVAVTV